MYLEKYKKLGQDATEMFISEFENKESLCGAISKRYKNRNAKKMQVSKDYLNYLRGMVINLNFPHYFLVTLYVSRDSISSILKENNSICVF